MSQANENLNDQPSSAEELSPVTEPANAPSAEDLVVAAPTLPPQVLAYFPELAECKTYEEFAAAATKLLSERKDDLKGLEVESTLKMLELASLLASEDNREAVSKNVHQNVAALLGDFEKAPEMSDTEIDFLKTLKKAEELYASLSTMTAFQFGRLGTLNELSGDLDKIPDLESKILFLEAQLQTASEVLVRNGEETDTRVLHLEAEKQDLMILLRESLNNNPEKKGCLRLPATAKAIVIKIASIFAIVAALYMMVRVGAERYQAYENKRKVLQLDQKLIDILNQVQKMSQDFEGAPAEAARGLEAGIQGTSQDIELNLSHRVNTLMHYNVRSRYSAFTLHQRAEMLGSLKEHFDNGRVTEAQLATQASDLEPIYLNLLFEEMARSLHKADMDARIVEAEASLKNDQNGPEKIAALGRLREQFRNGAVFTQVQQLQAFRRALNSYLSNGTDVSIQRLRGGSILYKRAPKSDLPEGTPRPEDLLKMLEALPAEVLQSIPEDLLVPRTSGDGTKRSAQETFREMITGLQERGGAEYLSTDLVPFAHGANNGPAPFMTANETRYREGDSAITAFGPRVGRVGSSVATLTPDQEAHMGSAQQASNALRESSNDLRDASLQFQETLEDLKRKSDKLDEEAGMTGAKLGFYKACYYIYTRLPLHGE